MVKLVPVTSLAFLLVVSAFPLAPADAPLEDTAEFSGVLLGGGLGLHVMHPAPWRADHPVAVEPGVVGVRAALHATDVLAEEFGSDWWLALLDTNGEVLARTGGGYAPARELAVGWGTIDGAGFGEYTARIECGFCSAVTYTLSITRQYAAHGANLTVEDQRLYVLPSTSTPTPAHAVNTGATPMQVVATFEGLPEGWSATSEARMLPVGGGADFDLVLTAPAELPAGTTVAFDAVLRDADLGHELDRVPMEAAFTHGLSALVASSHVVVALIDTGINPYHVEFRGPGSAVEHPAYFVDGYPADAQALPLTLDAPDYATAKAADADIWAHTKGSTLYYVPGTRIVGMICYGTASCQPDEGGHGTGTASLVGGTTTGEAPDALIVSVTGDIFGGARWAARQPWIDVVSMSIGPWVGTCLVWNPTCDVGVGAGTGNPYVPFSTYGAQKEAYLSGKRWFTGSSQGVGAWAAPAGVGVSGPCYHRWSSAFSGSPWTFAVETYWPWTELPWRSGCEPDVVAQGWDLVAASAVSLEGHNSFGHASGATPQAAGMYARGIQEARRVLGSTQEGALAMPLVDGAPNALGDGILATGAPTAIGPLADGVLTVREAERVFLHSLEQVNVVQSYLRHGADERWTRDARPVAPGAEYESEGYGLVTDTARAELLDVMRGDAIERLRPDDDAAYAASWAQRMAFWEAQSDLEVWVF